MRKSKAELDQLWHDPANWSWWGYRCREDHRLMVPKRWGLGWTFNYSHPELWKAYLIVLGFMAAPTSIVLLLGLNLFGPERRDLIVAAMVVVTVLSGVGVAWWSYRQAKG